MRLLSITNSEEKLDRELRIQRLAWPDAGIAESHANP
jgi:hypothetical protein